MGTEALNLSKKELLNLGEQYLKIRNYDNAMKYLSRAVQQGSSRAGTKLFELATAFYKKQDFGPAFRAFQLLADKGHGESSLYLGKMYERGLGVKASLQKSFDCYASAYQKGIPMGAYLAGKLMTTDALRSEEVRDIAISWFREAIAGGVYESYAAIGKLYMEDGWRAQPGDPPKSNKTALSWFLRGAVRGDNLSREMAGDFFITGTGTAQNIRRGMELYTQAFHDGSVSVCFKLGDLYSNGRYVHKNLDLSIAWYLKAYERGDVRGKYYAGHISFLAGKVYPALPEGTEEKKKALQPCHEGDERHASFPLVRRRNKGGLGFPGYGKAEGNSSMVQEGSGSRRHGFLGHAGKILFLLWRYSRYQRKRFYQSRPAGEAIPYY